jgi:hypothetical protein
LREEDKPVQSNRPSIEGLVRLFTYKLGEMTVMNSADQDGCNVTERFTAMSQIDPLQELRSSQKCEISERRVRPPRH